MNQQKTASPTLSESVSKSESKNLTTKLHRVTETEITNKKQNSNWRERETIPSSSIAWGKMEQKKLNLAEDEEEERRRRNKTNE